MELVVAGQRCVWLTSQPGASLKLNNFVPRVHCALADGYPFKAVPVMSRTSPVWRLIVSVDGLVLSSTRFRNLKNASASP